jgi:LysM domain
MSVVLQNDDTTTSQPSPSLFGSHPYMMILIVVAIGFLIYQVILSKKAPTSTAATAASAPPVMDANGNPVPNAGLSTDSNGNPIVYAATTDEFMNYNYSYDSNNTGQFAGNSGDITGGAGNTTGPVSTVTNNPPPVVHTGPPPVNTGPPPHQGPQPRPIIKPPVPKAGSWTCRYTVVEGDELGTIASRYNTTWPAIYGHNTGTINAVAGLMHEIIPGGPWNNIRPGEVLFVPCK